MIVKKQTTKACCGSTVTILVADKPIRKHQIEIFKTAGFKFPDNYYQAGVFYAHRDGLIATCSYGSIKISIRCVGADCFKMLEKFEELLDEAIKL